MRGCRANSSPFSEILNGCSSLSILYSQMSPFSFDPSASWADSVVRDAEAEEPSMTLTYQVDNELSLS